jgi:hypothetical protein
MRAVGVHPVDASEPVHLIEVYIAPDQSVLDWASVTQPGDDPDRSYWQAAWDEQQVPGSPWSLVLLLSLPRSVSAFGDQLRAARSSTGLALCRHIFGSSATKSHNR